MGTSILALGPGPTGRPPPRSFLLMVCIALMGCDPCSAIDTEMMITHCDDVAVGESTILRMNSSCAISSCSRYLSFVPEGRVTATTEDGMTLIGPDTYRVPAAVRVTGITPGRVMATARITDGNSFSSTDTCEFTVTEAPPGDGGPWDTGPRDSEAPDVSPPDAGYDSGGLVDGGAAPCTTVLIPPVRAVTVDELTGPAAELTGPWCGDPDGLLAPGDGAAVGLAYRSIDTTVDLAPSDGVDRVVTACVGVDFDGPYDVSQVRVIAAAMGEACGDRCGGDYCHTGQTAAVYGSIHGDDFAYLGGVTVPDRAFGVTAAVAVATVRYVLVCRGGWGHGRDNLEVDYVELCPAL